MYESFHVLDKTRLILSRVNDPNVTYYYKSLIYLGVFLVPRLLNIEVASQSELRAIWSNDDGVENKYRLCWSTFRIDVFLCLTKISSETTISISIDGLQAATKYIIYVAQYSKDGKTLGGKIERAAITRSG